jgi:hypothetical protein
MPCRVLAIINDSVGVLAASCYFDQATEMGVILGTGTNACIVVPVSRMPKWQPKGISLDTRTAINTEWGCYGSALLPRVKEDLELDADSGPQQGACGAAAAAGAGRAGLGLGVLAAWVMCGHSPTSHDVTVCVHVCVCVCLCVCVCVCARARVCVCAHPPPTTGRMLVEKLMSGLYMGDCARRLLLSFARHANLFGGQVPEGLTMRDGLSTAGARSPQTLVQCVCLRRRGRAPRGVLGGQIHRVCCCRRCLLP